MKKLLIIIGALSLVACEKAPEATVKQGEFVVERLFTNEGCTAYRFNDAGHFVYYTNCSGSTQSTVVKQCGKTPCNEELNVNTYRK
jgi:hypothetical protein